MNNVTSKNVFIANVLVILSLLGLFIFTKGAYADMQETLEKKDRLVAEKTTTENTLKNFKFIKKRIDEGGATELQKFANEFNEANAIDFVFDAVKDTEINAIVKEINVSKPTLNKFGFTEARMELSLDLGNVDRIMTLIDNINNSEKYEMFIENFTLPNSKESEGLDSIKLPYVVYFK